MLNGGIAATLLDCHSAWTAAHHLMVAGGLDHPPVVVTADLRVQYHRPTPSDRPVHLTARVAEATDPSGGHRRRPELRRRRDGHRHARRSSPCDRTIRPTAPDRRSHPMVFERFFGSSPGAPAPASRRPRPPRSPTETATVRRIVGELESLPPDRARHLAGVRLHPRPGGQLGHGHRPTTRRALMERIVMEHGGDPRGRRPSSSSRSPSSRSACSAGPRTTS